MWCNLHRLGCATWTLHRSGCQSHIAHFWTLAISHCTFFKIRFWLVQSVSSQKIPEVEADSTPSQTRKKTLQCVLPLKEDRKHLEHANKFRPTFRPSETSHTKPCICADLGSEWYGGSRVGVPRVWMMKLHWVVQFLEANGSYKTVYTVSSSRK